MKIHIHTSPIPETPQPDDDVTVSLDDLTEELVYKDGTFVVMDSHTFYDWPELLDTLKSRPADAEVEIVRYRITFGG
jgi:hypothetical protein